MPYPRPTTFAGRGKPARGEAGRGGLSGAGKNCHPYAEKRKKQKVRRKTCLEREMQKVLPRTGTEKNHRERLERNHREKLKKKTLRAMIGSKKEK